MDQEVAPTTQVQSGHTLAALTSGISNSCFVPNRNSLDALGSNAKGYIFFPVGKQSKVWTLSVHMLIILDKTKSNLKGLAWRGRF